MGKSKRHYRRPADHKHLSKISKRRFLYTPRVATRRYETWMLYSVDNYYLHQFYFVLYLPALCLFLDWHIWGRGTLFIGGLGFLITFGIFIKTMGVLPERLKFEREKPVKSIRVVWWEHMRVILYLNVSAITMTVLLTMIFQN